MFSETDLAAVSRAIASGELVVQFADRRVEYRTLPELIQARELIRSDLERQGLLAAPPRSYVLPFSRE